MIRLNYLSQIAGFDSAIIFTSCSDTSQLTNVELGEFLDDLESEPGETKNEPTNIQEFLIS